MWLFSVLRANEAKLLQILSSMISLLESFVLAEKAAFDGGSCRGSVNGGARGFGEDEEEEGGEEDEGDDDDDEVAQPGKRFEVSFTGFNAQGYMI